MLTPGQPGADTTNTEPNKPTTSDKLNASREQIDSGAPRHRPSVFDLQPDDLSTAGSCATALARRHRTDSLGRVEVTDRDDMPLGLHDPRAQARRAGAVPGPSAVGGVHEAAGQRDAASRAVARDRPGATSVVIPRQWPVWSRSRSSSPITSARPCVPAAWAAAGAAARMLHDAPLPRWPGWSPGELASHLDG